jgi:hypothetical protein
MRTMGAGRPSKLTPDLIDRLAALVALGAEPASAAVALGVGRRTLRRWRAVGGRQVAALDLPARLVLALDRAQTDARRADWRAAALRLEAEAPERWSPPPLDELLDELQ